MPDTQFSKTVVPTVNDAIRHLRGDLTPIYGRGETEAIIRLIFQHLKDWSPVDMIINENKPLSDYMQGKLADIEKRLLVQEPIQYITGIAYFYGMDFHVEPGVLIPRPETEELVDLIVSRNKRRDLDVLDIGTGSGCIAIALSRNLPFSNVTALDVSQKAIEVTDINAKELHARIKTVQADIFKWTPEPDSYDIIVSNPPYVGESERTGMAANVLRYEPKEAIFVPDNDPLLFYRRIADVAKAGLKADGTLYFEINPLHATALHDMLADMGFVDIEIVIDSCGKRRFISCHL